MDDTDKLILKVLMENSRTSYKEIAKTAKISDVAVHKRIKKLKPVIRAFTVTVDQKEMDRTTVALVNIKCEVGRTNDIADELKEIGDVTEVYTTVGEYDIVAKVRTRDLETMKDIVKRSMAMIEGISEIRTSMVFDCKKEDINLVF